MLRKQIVVLALVVLALFVTSASAADPVNNRLRGTISREFSDLGKLTEQGDYRNTAGASFEHLFTERFGFQVDAFRDLEDPDSWQGSADLTLHAGPVVFQGGAGYDDLSEDYLLNAGVGLDHCSGSYCAQIVLRYYRDLESGEETEGSDLKLGTAYHLALGIGFGFGW